MAVTQYIGARYVPVFADPVEWDKTSTYEPLTIVMSGGDSYTSKQYVPSGVEITDTSYWIETGNYNAQIEQYRQEVMNFSERISDVEDEMSGVLEKLPDSAFSSENTIKDAIDAEASTRTSVDNEIIASVTTEITNRENADEELDNKITAEATARQTADASITTQITDEISARVTADANLTTQISTETSTRQAADTALGNQISDETSARMTADSSLATQITDETSARVSADNTLTTQMTALNSLSTHTKYYGHRMVVIGDSYAYGTGASDHGSGDTKRFSTLLATMLGATEVNEAVGSTGFCDPGSSGESATFQTQVSRAASALTTDERNDVRLVLIAGGINDAREGDTYTHTQMATAAMNACTSAKAYFQNASIVVFPMLWNGQGWTAQAFDFECAIVEGVMKSKCGIAIQGCWTWNFGVAARYASDNLHPVDAGHLNIASRMYESIVNGGTTNYENNYFSPTIQGGSEDNNTYAVLQNGMINYGCMKIGTDGTTISANTNIGTVPPAMYPRQTAYAPVYKGNQFVGTFAIAGSGNIYVIPSSSITFPCWVGPLNYMPWGGELNT